VRGGGKEERGERKENLDLVAILGSRRRPALLWPFEESPKEGKGEKEKKKRGGKEEGGKKRDELL